MTKSEWRVACARSQHRLDNVRIDESRLDGLALDLGLWADDQAMAEDALARSPGASMAEAFVPPRDAAAARPRHLSTATPLRRWQRV